MKNRIRERRAELSLSQAELATICGVSRLTILSVELGRSEPSLPLAFRLSRALRLPVETLFEYEAG